MSIIHRKGENAIGKTTNKDHGECDCILSLAS
jgi:hypothetical protein